MWNDKYLSLMNFKVKLHCQRHFFINEHDVACAKLNKQALEMKLTNSSVKKFRVQQSITKVKLSSETRKKEMLIDFLEKGASVFSASNN